ncbi:Planctomycete cytochrome C [Planctomycetes bacterium CA13]|uniref:Planctomycete cytochrome C n=2 Tax=Novipirellula herctigrandis TaxID=2527986 RepID=A0A5C5YNL7_9BACT|nr:Planctomycete cytochrome C [Planctomycetes bacterium CA13]
MLLPFRSFRTNTSAAASCLFFLGCLVGCLIAAVCCVGVVHAEQIQFGSDIQPILAKHCLVCHGPDESEAGVSFADFESATAETDSGDYAIVPGDVEASALIARVTSDDLYEQMPPEGDRLSQSEIELLRNWIDEGAKWNKHWAFQPMQNPKPPSVDNPRWSENPIDAFVYQSLGEVDLTPNPPADRRVMIRRAYYDLTGLPPSPEQVDDFIADPNPNAHQTMVDRLLDSPHYGERWGRHWLDLVHYGETNSFERDNPKPNAYKYRDYVIRSFNNNKPYDQFVREQLAGDELDSVTTETLTATGYYRLGIWDDEPADPLQARFDELDDLITTTGQAFLGLTINCARCHDHKIDPIPQTDYYSMLAFFEDVTRYGHRGDQVSNHQIDVSSDELNTQYHQADLEKQRLDSEMREIEQAGIAKMAAVDQRATEGNQAERRRVLKEQLHQNLTAEQQIRYDALRDDSKQLRAKTQSLPPREIVMGLARYIEKSVKTFVLFRGNPHSPADQVTPSFPEIFEDGPLELDSGEIVFRRTDAFGNKSWGRRRTLADWIAKNDNRLTARVMVNRIWQFHFGRGIVRSSNNFGRLGTPPTHPKLLDWLALEFIRYGWDIKSMHRLMMNSQTYQMTSATTDEGNQRDPDNDLFWRFDSRRLSAEEVRDSILAVNGSLNRTVYGPSFYEKLSDEVLAGQSRPGYGWGDSSPDDQNRRSIYIHVKRSLLTPILTAFDFPDPDLTCEARFTTLQPGQALSLLNSDFIHEQARRLAKSVDVQAVSNDEVVRRTIRRVLGRDATDAEVGDGCDLIETLSANEAIDRTRAAELYTLSVMNWNEFLFVD